ncbi:hypothetical protein D3C85_1050250 [compost metagenome]
MRGCLAGQSNPQSRQVGFDQAQRIAQLQDQSGVHDVLAGRPKVHVALGCGIAQGNLFAQGLDQGNRRIACQGNGLAEGLKIVEVGLAGRLDRCHRCLRDNSDAGLGARQCGLEIEHALHTALVAEHLPHAAGSEVGIEQLVARWLAHSKILNARARCGAREQINDRGAGTPPVWAGAG